MSTRPSRNSSAAFRRIRQEMLSDPDACCAYCLSTENLQIDHVIPVSAGADELDRSNLQILCEYHNKQKGSRVAQRTTWANPRWLPEGI